MKLAQIFGGKVESKSSSVGMSVSRSSSSDLTTNLPSGSKEQQDSGESGLGGGVIAGIIFGALAGLAVLAAIILFALRRRKNRRLGFAEGSMAPPRYRQHEELRYEKDADNQITELEQPRSELAGGIGGVHEKANNEERCGGAHQVGLAELSGTEVR